MECSKKNECRNYGEKCYSCASLSDAINNYPWYETKDVSEVVRCKKCKNRKKSAYGDRYFCNARFGMSAVVALKDDDFCSYGERMDPDA